MIYLILDLIWLIIGVFEENCNKLSMCICINIYVFIVVEI